MAFTARLYFLPEKGSIMRSNPIYQNICWIRFGRYQYKKCIGCSKEQECDNTIGENLSYNGLSAPTKTHIIAPKCERCGATMKKRSEKTRKRKGQITPIYAYFYCTECEFKKGYTFNIIKDLKKSSISSYSGYLIKEFEYN